MWNNTNLLFKSLGLTIFRLWLFRVEFNPPRWEICTNEKPNAQYVIIKTDIRIISTFVRHDIFMLLNCLRTYVCYLLEAAHTYSYTYTCRKWNDKHHLLLRIAISHAIKQVILRDGILYSKLSIIMNLSDAQQFCRKYSHNRRNWLSLYIF